MDQGKFRIKMDQEGEAKSGPKSSTSAKQSWCFLAFFGDKRKDCEAQIPA
jgi:hypothetical protein